MSVTQPSPSQPAAEQPVVAPAAEPLKADSFAHLHSHSDYSLLDGISDPATLVRAAGNLGQPALALTDHGRLSGTAAFAEAIGWYNQAHAERHEASKSCAKNLCHSVLECRDAPRCPKKHSVVADDQHAQLTPFRGLFGLETYFAEQGRDKRSVEYKSDRGHLVLIAANETGWANLRKLASLASLEGQYYSPRIDWQLLETYSEGLIALSACLGGHLARILRAGGETAADALISRYRDLMPGRYFLELQWHLDQDPGGDESHREQWNFNRYLISAGKRLGVPLVFTNDLHYTRRDQALLEEIVLANQQKLTLAEVAQAKRDGKNVLSFDTPDYFVKSRAEIGAAVSDWLRHAKTHDPELAETILSEGRSWLNRTLEIAALVADFEPFKKGLHFPTFPVPEGETPESYLAKLVWQRAEREDHYPQISERVRRLISYELQCVQELGFAPYFLITTDFIDYAGAQGVTNDDPPIDVGIGRGSAPGSIVTYSLGITDVDPVKYGLSEGGIGLTRFLNPAVFYGLRAAAFGSLDAECAELEAPTAEEMEAALAASLNDRFKSAKINLAAGRQPFTGVELRAAEMKAWDARLADMRRRLTDEWSAIKRWGVSNAMVSAIGEPSRFDRTALVAPLWRWLHHVAAGHPVGTANEHNSYLAHFLGLTAIAARAPEGADQAILPDYEFRHSRKSMPDIDIDFTPGHDGREKVMRYIVERYGPNHVAQIATFSSMLSKSAIKDVARAKGLPAVEADELTNLIPKKFAAVKNEETGEEEEEAKGVSLWKMIYSDLPSVVEGSRELRARMAADPKVDEIVRLAAQIEGMKRGVSTHACGVLITPEPVTDLVPVEKTDKGTGVQATYDGKTLEDLGLLKVDFLGIENLKVNRACVERIAEGGGPKVNWRRVPDDDPTAMKMLREGRTAGIFQFNSDFATGILKQIKPKKVQDLMVATALGRPGPMQYIPRYVEARAAGHGEYGDPVFGRYASPILEETYGILVYQEQVMLLSIALADFTLTDADGLRKATAKKSADLLAKYRSQFVEGAVGKGVARAFIENFWDQVLTPFALYSFNKSHSTAYALMAYKQAYLKASYLPEFMAALMTVDQHRQAKEKGGPSLLARAIAEARRLDLEMRPLDLNHSTDRIEIEWLGPETRATVSADSEAPSPPAALRLSLAATKGIGEKPIRAILTERAANGPYQSLRDLISRTVEVEREKDPLSGRTIPAAVNKTAVCNLIKTGALDAFGDRGQQLALAEAYFATASVKKRAEIAWGSVTQAIGATPRDYFEWEHDLLGFYSSAHPASSIPDETVEAVLAEAAGLEQRRSRENGKPAREIDRASTADCLAFTRVRDSEPRLLVGIASDFRFMANRSGVGGRLVGKISDETGTARLVVWLPKESEGLAARNAFAALRERAETGAALGLAVLGGFSFNEKWDKMPGIVAERWWELALAERALPVALEVAAPPLMMPDPTTLARDEAAIDQGLAAILD